MNEKNFETEMGVTFSDSLPNGQPEEEIIFDWNGEELSE